MHLGHTLAESCGFDNNVQMALNRVLFILLADHVAGESI